MIGAGVLIQIRPSFVPDPPTQALRIILRTRKQFVREKTSHILRIQKTLEDANIKLDSVITDILGVSGRKMIEALIASEVDPAKLARLADRRLKASQDSLREALRGRVTNSQRFLLRLHLGHMMPSMQPSPSSIGRWRPPLHRFAPPSNK